MDLAHKLNITHKLFALVTFVLYRILPSTATQNTVFRETPTIGFINKLINQDVAVGSLARASKSPKFVMASLGLVIGNMNTGQLDYFRRAYFKGSRHIHENQI